MQEMIPTHGNWEMSDASEWLILLAIQDRRVCLEKDDTQRFVVRFFVVFHVRLVQSHLFDVIRKAAARGGHAVRGWRVVATLYFEDVWSTKSSGRINRRRRHSAGKNNRNLQ